jgi:tetratricopeptide (TPR) repeat protein
LIIVVSSFFYSINRNKDWATKKSLYLADIDKVSKSAKANSLLGSEYQVEAMKMQKEGTISFSELMQKVDSSIFFYDQSLSIFKEYESNLNNKGVLIYTYKYDYPEALKLFKYSTSFNKDYKEGFVNCGNAEAKIAEVYFDLLMVTNVNDSSEIVNNKELDLFENQFTTLKMHQAVSIIKQFEQNLKTFIQNKNQGNIRAQIMDNATNLETINPTLRNKSFATKIGKIVNAKNIPAQQIYNNIIAANNEIRKEILNEIFNQLNIDKRKQFVMLQALKKRKQISSRSNFKVALKLSKNDKKYFQIISQMAMLSQDFEWIAELQEIYIKLHPKEYLGKNYSELINSLIASKNKQKAKEYCNRLIEIESNYIKNNRGKFYGEQYVRVANAYLTLEKNQEAFENFRKGAEEFKREKQTLEKKLNKSTIDSQRIEMLTREIENLKRFKERIMNQKPIK